MTTALQMAMLALLGLSVGSFLNVCIDRLPAGRSIARLASHCETCNQKLSARDLVPLFSYLWLRGRCRRCGARIPLRLPLVELATALIFAFLTWNYGLNLQLAIVLVYACIFLTIFFIDLEQQLVLDIVVYLGMALALAFSFFWLGFGDYWPSLGIASALLGGVVGAIFMLLAYLVSRAIYSSEAMGFGDVLLAALIGMAVGFPLVLIALLMGILGGGLVAIVLVALRRKRRRDTIPLAPFLATATMVTLVWGIPILDWYSGLL